MSRPLADRIRPRTLDEMVGQRHLLGPGMALRNIVESGNIPNLIFYGPSGVGKTTLANIIAEKTSKKLYRLNATTSGIADIKDMVAEVGTLAAPNGILLYLDEIQYFNKKQQQSLLEYLESGDISMIAATTSGVIAAMLMLGGAVGNMLDRFFRGYVIDMFEALFVDFAIFNVADAALTVGTALMALSLLTCPEEWRDTHDGSK